jgi:hypothetical protein
MRRSWCWPPTCRVSRGVRGGYRRDRRAWLAPLATRRAPVVFPSMARRRRRSGRRATERGSQPWVPPRPWHDWGESDAEIAAFEDDPDALRLTITVSLVVRVTREKVLDRFAREVFAAHREVLDAADFAPLAYQAACQEGWDDVAGGPEGRISYLVDPEAVVSDIPGIAVEDASMVIERTPLEVVRRLRENHGFLEQPGDGMMDEATGDEPF